MNIDNVWAKHKKLISYLFVGGILFVIDYSVSLFAYHAFDMAAGFASATGFCASFVVGFTLNKKVVFKHTQASLHSLNVQITLYLLLATINLLLTSFIVDYVVNAGVAIEIIKPVVVIAAACWNYVILGRFIFGHKKPEQVN